jgi:hypothetical protein
MVHRTEGGYGEGGGLLHQNHMRRVWALKAHEDLLAQVRCTPTS